MEVRLTDRAAVADALTQAYLFVATVNATSATEALAADKPQDQPSLVVDLRNRCASGEVLPESSSEVVSSFTRLRGLPSLQGQIIDQVAEIMVRPLSIEAASMTTATWRLGGPRRHRNRLTPPSTVEAGFHIRKGSARAGFVTSYNAEHRNRIRGTITYWDPTYDPISILEAFCINGLGVRDVGVDHYIQQWIKEAFGLRFDEHRDLLQVVCRRVNRLLLHSEYPSRDQVHASRPVTVDLSTLLDTLTEVFAELNNGHGSPEIHALGIYALLRFSKAIRIRYGWVQPEGPSSEEQAEAFGTMSSPRLCISAARPLEFMHLQVRAFGGLVGIEGLSYIFRGGILPRSEKGHSMVVRGPAGGGKTAFSTHLMADIARRGRCAAYFAIEESNEAIVDRLEAFWLYDRRLFEILQFPKDKRRLKKVHDSGKGVFLIISQPPGQALEVGGTLATLAKALRPLHRYRWRAISIDSIDALKFQLEDSANDLAASDSRTELRQLFRAVEANRFFGVLTAEQGGTCARYASFLADTEVELGRAPDDGPRWLRINKSRFQPAHVLKHTFRIREGKGARIYPALSAVQSATRRKVRATLSADRNVPLPPFWKDKLKLDGLKEKSSTVIYGPTGSGKTELALALATAPSVARGRTTRRALYPPRGLHVVTFRTSELIFRQMVEHDVRFGGPWAAIAPATIRWYSPGDQFDASQLLADIRERIRVARRHGIRIDRVLFDEIEAVAECLPRVAVERLFWPTLLHLLSTEAITSIFVVGNDGGESRPILRTLRTTCDYTLALGETQAVEKKPDLLQTNVGEEQA